VSNPVFGITGWKNSGKTTLVERLVAEFVRRGWRISTVKHGHHDVDIDQPGRDSHRHRTAGAREVAIVGGKRYAIMHELSGGEAEPTLQQVLSRLSPVDLVLIEGYKREAHAKIEVRGPEKRESLAARDPAVVAIAVDEKPEEDLPWFRRDDVAGIADFIANRVRGG
jgi:molybdopterin-guanine dinucleotide biosynthesis protein B